MAYCLIQGASRGVGLELTRQLVDRGARVFATCRSPSDASALRRLAASHANELEIVKLDVTDESSIAAAARRVREETSRLDLLMNVAGLLHDETVGPEKKLGHVKPEKLRRVFEVNAFGPLLVAKHFADLLVHGDRAVLANVSARVGSITDNRLGGWYAYRASKAAQNMLTKTMAIELGRRSNRLAVVALHPGTVDTDLSKPFQRNVPAERLFAVERAARQLLDVVDGLDAEQTGRFFAYDGSTIPW